MQMMDVNSKMTMYTSLGSEVTITDQEWDSFRSFNENGNPNIVRKKKQIPGLKLLGQELTCKQIQM